MQTNDPRLKSFIDVAPDSHFPIQNLPFGVFSSADRRTPRIVIAIGEQVIDLAVLEEAGLLTVPAGKVFDQPSLNALIAQGRAVWRAPRAAISALLRHDNPLLRASFEASLAEAGHSPARAVNASCARSRRPAARPHRRPRRL